MPLWELEEDMDEELELLVTTSSAVKFHQNLPCTNSYSLPSLSGTETVASMMTAVPVWSLPRLMRGEPNIRSLFMPAVLWLALPS